MENSKTEKICLIIIFNVLVPSLDQYTDISLARRLFMGPDDDLNVLSGKTRLYFLNFTKYRISVIAFPYKQIFNGTFSEQSDTIQTMYRMVTFIKKYLLPLHSLYFSHILFLGSWLFFQYFWLCYFHVWFALKWVSVSRDKIELTLVLEKESSIFMRTLTFLIAMVGLYPQYRALRKV